MSTPTDPKAKATSIIDALPGNSFLSKSGILATSAAGAIYAISNQLIIVNDESILVACFFGVVALVGKVLGPMYGDWARNQTNTVKELLNSSKGRHIDAVQDRIGQVSNLKDVVATTKALFEMSKETATLEAQAFELKQKVDAVHEAKSVLDSWVKYEGQIRQMEQEQLAKSVISKVQSEVSNPKFQDKVLSQAVEDIERLFAKEK